MDLLNAEADKEKSVAQSGNADTVYTATISQLASAVSSARAEVNSTKKELDKVADYITFVDRGRALLTEEKDTLVEVYGVLKGPAARMGEVEPGDAIGLPQTKHGFEGLVRDKAAMARKYPDFLVDRANLEEVILYLVRENREGSEEK